LLKDENGDVLTDSDNILNKVKNYFCQIQDVNGVNDVRQTEIHTAEPLVDEPNLSRFKLLEMKRYKSQGANQTPAEPIKAGGETRSSETHTLIDFIWNKEELSQKWKESIAIHVYKTDRKTDCSNCRGVTLLPTTYKILSNILLSRFAPYVGIIQCGC